MIRLTTEQRTRLEDWSRAAYPHEACGVLVGTREGERVHVHGVVRARNLEELRPEARFELDPAAIVRAEREARARGQEVVGVWHSHPDRPAAPSAEDRRGVWHGWCQVIVGVDGNGSTSVHASLA